MTYTASSDGRYDVLAEACPTRQVVNRIGDRWSLLVLYALEDGTLRTAELRRAVEGITQMMLTQTLRLLERDGLVRREVFAAVPPRGEYSLTPLGRGLSGRIAAIREWAYANMADIEAARRDFDTLSRDRALPPPPAAARRCPPLPPLPAAPDARVFLIWVPQQLYLLVRYPDHGIGAGLGRWAAPAAARW
jgi:DNA-binding HxlR family transcriptional regulator